MRQRTAGELLSRLRIVPPDQLLRSAVAENQDGLAAHYRRPGFGVLPSLVAAEAASAWEQSSRPLPCRRVDGGQDRSRIWLEQGGPALGTLLGPFCQQRALQVLLRRLSRLEQLDPSRQRLWINSYRPGDQVPATAMWRAIVSGWSVWRRHCSRSWAAISGSKGILCRWRPAMRCCSPRASGAMAPAGSTAVAFTRQASVA